MILCSFGCPQEVPYEEPEEKETAPENGGWDIKEHESYEMKIGEAIVVYSEGLSCDDYRLVDEEGEIYKDDALKWSKDDAGYFRVLTAENAGSVILKIEVPGDGDETVIYSCVITVIENNSSTQEEKIEDAIVGIWKNNKSSIIFNNDNSGRIILYELDETVFNSNFNYVVYKDIDENDEESIILSIRNTNNELYNADYVIQLNRNKDSDLQLKIYGKLPGLPSPSTWKKQ